MRPRDIGTRAETMVVRWLALHGFPYAERRSLKGTLDQGDVTGIPGVCIEIKGGDAARTASDGQVDRWLAEVEVERVNAGADVGVLVVQRARQPVERWSAILPRGSRIGGLGLDLGPTPVVLRCQLRDMAALLRAADYGDPSWQEPVPA